MNFSSIGHMTKWIPAFFLMAGFLFSCVNDLDTIQRVTYDPNTPEEIAENLTVFYTDSGYARVEISANIAETTRKEDHITYLKNGLSIQFYNETGTIVSSLSAVNGEINFDTGKAFVYDSVQLKNIEQNQLLETEELHWNRTDSTIYTDKNVVVTTPDKIGYGQGIRSTQEFDRYEILKPSGKFTTSK